MGVPGRVILNGPRVLLPHGPAVALNMVFHELGTNAAKYGVLSSPSGQLHINWSVETSGLEQFVNFRWEETGGPPVEAPTRRGFGSRLVKRTLASLGGSAEMNFSPSGLIAGSSCRFRWTNLGQKRLRAERSLKQIDAGGR